MGRLRKKIIYLSMLASLVITVSSVAINHPYNVKDNRITYIVGYAHLDTQWLWTLDRTIRTYIPNTLNENHALFNNYNQYCFTFEGAYRLDCAKKFHSSAYNRLKGTSGWVAKGNWANGGSFVDGCDVNVPSTESLIRHVLYGNEYYRNEFGDEYDCIDILLPDCFGFPYSLPTIASHCGLYGFSTQKFDLWGGWRSTPFAIGLWQGVDGSKIIACLKPGSYGDQTWSTRSGDGDALNSACGAWVTLDYCGVGDVGGSTRSSTVQELHNKVNNNTATVKVVSEASDRIYRDFLKYPDIIDDMPVYNGELVMRRHGVGCYTSWATVKSRNRECELRSQRAEHASIMGNWLADEPHVGSDFWYAYFRFLARQMHDDLTGTSIQSVYRDYTIPGYDSSLATFQSVLNAKNAKMGEILNTTVESGRVPIVVQNCLGCTRTDVVAATINWGSTAPAEIQVFGPDGQEVVSQVNGRSGNNLTLAFVATVPPMSHTVYQIAASASSLTSELTATTSRIENEYYRVDIDNNGDISQVYDKKLQRNLLRAPSRWEFRPDAGTSFPAWEIRYEDVTASVRDYADNSVQKTVVEEGPARVSVRVTRTASNSSFTHYIRLGAGDAGSFVETENIIDWNSLGNLLKVSWPTAASNSNASFDLGIGAIARPNRNSNRYEVPSASWTDLTNSDNSYGISILAVDKYGWDKSADNMLRHTMIHSPQGGGYDYPGDRYQHRPVRYGIYGHAGNWQGSDVVHQAERFNQPLHGFKPSVSAGSIGKQVSMLSVKEDPPQFAIMALKKKEKTSSNEYIIRVREIRRESVTGAKITFNGTVGAVKNVTGQETDITAQSLLPRVKPGAVTRVDNNTAIQFDLKPFEIRTFAFTLTSVNTQKKVPSVVTDISPKKNISINQVGRGSVDFVVNMNEKIKKIYITNMAGKTVQVIAPKASLSNAGVYRWNGKTMSGGPVSSGIYIVHVVTDKQHAVTKFPMLQ